jgi:hypothetical protein
MTTSFKSGDKKLNTMSDKWYDELFDEDRKELADAEYAVSVFEHLDEENETEKEEQE